jgi:hypothetical protein
MKLCVGSRSHTNAVRRLFTYLATQNQLTEEVPQRQSYCRETCYAPELTSL